MGETKQATVLRFMEAFERGDLDAAMAMATDDVVLDRSHSKGVTHEVSRGQAAVRAAHAEYFDPIKGLRWEQGRMRTVGRDLIAVETEVSMQGRTSGINVIAHGGWLIRFEGALLAEGVLLQSYDEALLEARRRALAAARLYFVCEAQPGGQDPSALLAAAIAGGVDVIQMREKAPRCAEELIAFADPFARTAQEHGALFFLNDEPGLVESCDADGVHVGQDDDERVADARRAAGAAALVGLSTHSPTQFDAALATTDDARPDQLSAGPVWETPTKAGRPAAGLELIAHAARVTGADTPWFAIGGIDAANISEVVAAGARRVVVVRAIRDAADPRAAAAELRLALDAASAD